MVLMNKLDKLLESIENFYRSAVLSYTLLKYAAPGDSSEQLLDEAENLWDQTDNKGLADQLENIITSYRKFNEALNASPGDMLSNPEGSAESEADTIDSLAETLNSRWQRLIANPYLALEADDPKYTESSSPERYLEVAESLVEDANRYLEQKAQSIGFSPEELRMIQEQERAPEIPKTQEEAAESKKRSEVLDAKKRYNRTFRDKMKEVRKIGPANLQRARDALQQKIQTTTNAVEQEELARRLKHLPDPESYHKYLATVRRSYQKAISDPIRKEKINQNNVIRKNKQLERDNKKGALIAAIQQSQSTAEKQRLTKDLVRLEESILELKGKNLDDGFVRNDPMIQSMLNPDDIIRRYNEKMSKWAPAVEGGKYRTEEVQHRQKLYKASELPGLTLTFRHDLSTVVNEAKRALNRKIERTGPNDPVFKPYYEAVRTATDPQSKAAAMSALEAFTKQYKENHPLVKAVVERIVPLVAIKDELAELVSSRRKGEAVIFKNPWITSNEPLPADKKVKLTEIYHKLKKHIGAGFTGMGADLDGSMGRLAEAIAERIGGV